MDMVNCSNNFDSNKTAAFRTGVCEKGRFLLEFFTNLFVYFVHFVCTKYFSAG